MRKEMLEWQKNMGISLITRPSEDLIERVIKCNGRIASSLNSEELDEMILAGANYYLFLQCNIGELVAKIEYLTRLLDKRVMPLAAKKMGGHFAERKALTISENGELDNISKRLNEYQVKYNMLRHVSIGIKSKIEILKRVYDRRFRS